jgi:hypothetical protein
VAPPGCARIICGKDRFAGETTFPHPIGLYGYSANPPYSAATRRGGIGGLKITTFTTRDDVNTNTPGGNAELFARIEFHHRHVPKAIAARITELSDGGLSDFEIQARTGLALPLVRLILRGGSPSGDMKR